MKVKVEVTAKDIKNGRRCDPNACPIALAAKRATKGRIIRALDNFFRLNDESTLPHSLKRVAKFIQNFDSSKPVKPFSFTISI